MNEDHGSDPPPRPRRSRRRSIAIVAGVLVAGLVVLAVGLLVGVRAGDSDTLPDSLRWSGRDTGGGFTERRWKVGTPPGPPPAEGRPAVVLLHGALMDLATLGRLDVIDALASSGAVVVLPEGLWSTWDAGECCVPASAVGVDDLGFLEQVVSGTATIEGVDPSRISVVGYSNGGLLAARYACVGDPPVAAVVVVSAVPWNTRGCDPLDVPISFVHGTGDEIVPFEGGRSVLGTLLSGGRANRAAVANAEEYAAAAGCRAEPEVTSFEAHSVPGGGPSDWVRRVWQGCRAEVSLTSVEGAKHYWQPGSGDGRSVTDEVLDRLGL